MIADIELSSVVCGVVVWASGGKSTGIYIIGTDNTNAFSWIRKGKARAGCSRRMISAFYHWMVTHDIEVSVYYIRSHHNLSADLLTRGDKEAITAWMARYNMTQIRLPWWWEAFAKTGACQVWTCAKRPNYWIPPTIKPQLANVVVGEWNGSNFSRFMWHREWVSA